MNVDDKILEAYFFLEKLKEPNLDVFVARHYFSAFLSSINSIFDYLLEDANQKFSLGITLNEYLDYEKFRKVAVNKGNTDAIKFIDWYDGIFNMITSLPVLSIFRIERNLNTHRRIQTPKLMAKMEPIDYMNGDRSAILEFTHILSPTKANEAFEEQKQLYLDRVNSEREQRGQPSTHSVIASLGFTYPDTGFTDLTELCSAFLEVMKTIVEDAKEKFLN